MQRSNASVTQTSSAVFQSTITHCGVTTAVVSFVLKASKPTAVLPLPVVFAVKADLPTATFSEPSVFAIKAL
jgi:hypothetical protein